MWTTPPNYSEEIFGVHSCRPKGYYVAKLELNTQRVLAIVDRFSVFVYVALKGTYTLRKTVPPKASEICQHRE